MLLTPINTLQNVIKKRLRLLLTHHLRPRHSRESQRPNPTLQNLAHDCPVLLVGWILRPGACMQYGMMY